MGAIHQVLMMRGSGIVSGGEVDPTTIPTCTEWVSGDQAQLSGFSDGQAIGDTTHRWEDRVSSGAKHWSQATSGLRPVYRNVGGPNSKPFIEFASGKVLDWSNTAGTLYDSDGHCSFVVVNPQQNGTTAGNEFGPNIYTQAGYLGIALFDSGGGTNKFRFYRYSGGYVGVNSQTTYSIGTWYIVECWYDGSLYHIRVNGDTDQTVSAGGYASDANVPVLAAQMKLSERITFDSNISSGDRDSLRASLATKYSITLP